MTLCDCSQGLREALDKMGYRRVKDRVQEHIATRARTKTRLLRPRCSQRVSESERERKKDAFSRLGEGEWLRRGGKKRTAKDLGVWRGGEVKGQGCQFRKSRNATECTCRTVN